MLLISRTILMLSISYIAIRSFYATKAFQRMLNFGPTQYGVGGKGGGDINSKKNKDGQHK